MGVFFVKMILHKVEYFLTYRINNKVFKDFYFLIVKIISYLSEKIQINY